MYKSMVDRLENGVRLMENSSPCSSFVSMGASLDGSPDYNVRIEGLKNKQEGFIDAVLQIPNSSIFNLVSFQTIVNCSSSLYFFG